jgi:polyisoprenoid-binding protein YceI
MTTWQLDNAHTQISFSAKHMMVTTVRGTFHVVAGTIELDEADPSRSRGAFQVQVATIDTNFGARDTHLRSADFFDAETWPTIDFVSTRIVARGGNAYDVTGDLTIRDVTRPTTFRVEVDGIVNGMTGARHVGLSASARIDRRDWGLDWNVALEQGGWLVSREIKIDIAIAADEVATTATPTAEAATEAPEAVPA